MNKQNQIFWVVFFMIFVVLFLLISINLDFFHSIISRGVLKYGYPAIFLLTFVIDLFESPINTDLPAIIATALGLNVLLVYIFATIGDFLGIFTSFYVGKKYLSHKIRNSCSTNIKYQKYCKFFYKYGPIALLVAMITPLPNVLFVWLAGSFHMKKTTFFVFGYLPSMLRMGILVLITKGIIG